MIAGDDRRFHLEELACALTHGVGAMASLVGGAVLITLAALAGDVWQVLSAAVLCAGAALALAMAVILGPPNLGPDVTISKPIPGLRAPVR